MNTFFSRSSPWRFFICPMALWLSVLTIFYIQESWGQDSLSFSSGLQPQENEWVSGPKKTSLGAFADLQIPESYRFTEAEGARILLKRMNNPVPTGLIGILSPNSGEWLAVMEFNEIGYVKDANKDGMNSKVILKAIQDRSEAQNNYNMNEGGATASVDWESQPVYDEKDHSLEWAIRAETRSGKVINHTVVLLGRRGVLDITMIKAYQGSSDLLPLKQLIKNISFKDGQDYADYQKGDKMAGVSLANLVVDDEHPAASEKSEDLPVRTASEPFAWIYLYYSLIGGGVVVFAGVLLLKNLLKRRKHRAVYKHGQHSSVATETLSKNETVLNGLKLNGLHGHNGRRIRRSNFGKFYANMITTLSSSSGGYLTQFENSNAHTKKKLLPLNEPGSDPANVSANLELIAIQNNLIEEQRRLMQQQSKLIEEKNRFIDEQSRFLERQSDVIEN